MNQTSLRASVENLALNSTGYGKPVFVQLRFDLAVYLVSYADGARERYQITYTAGIEAEGHPSGWRYRGGCWRQIALLNRAGERFEKAGLDGRIRLAPVPGEVGAVDWSAWRECPFQGTPPSADRDFKDIASMLSQYFHHLVADDKRRMENYFRHVYAGVEAVSEID